MQEYVCTDDMYISVYVCVCVYECMHKYISMGMHMCKCMYKYKKKSLI